MAPAQAILEHGGRVPYGKTIHFNMGVICGSDILLLQGPNDPCTFLGKYRLPCQALARVKVGIYIL